MNIYLEVLILYCVVHYFLQRVHDGERPVMANFAQYGFSGVVITPYTVERLKHALQRVLQSDPG
jgi:hypothetical protein